MVKETRDGSNKIRNWIPLDSLISDILFKSKLMQELMEAGMTNEVEFEIGKSFNGHNLKNLFFI